MPKMEEKGEGRPGLDEHDYQERERFLLRLPPVWRPSDFEKRSEPR